MTSPGVVITDAATRARIPAAIPWQPEPPCQHRDTDWERREKRVSLSREVQPWSLSAPQRVFRERTDAALFVSLGRL